MRRRSIVALITVVLVGVGTYAGTVLATPSSGLTSTNLAKSTFGDINLLAHAMQPRPWAVGIKTVGSSDVYIVDNKIAPGGSTGWHSHPGPSLIFVLAGTVTNYSSDDPSCAPHAYSAGSSFIDEGGGDTHILRNEGTVAAETIAVQFLPKDAVRRNDMPKPANCP